MYVKLFCRLQIKRSVMFKIFFILISVVLFIGCASQREQALLKSYHDNIEYHKHLQQTENAELKEGEQTMGMLTATYMFRPNFDKNDTRDEVFLMGVQLEDENATINFKQKSTSNTDEQVYTLTLNGSHAIKVKSLSPTDKRLKELSFVTGWNHYYEVTFANTKSKSFNLSFANPRYGVSLLNFSKVARFVYTKKGF